MKKSTEDEEKVNIDSLLLRELLEAFSFSREDEASAYKEETEQAQTELKKDSLENLTVERIGARKSARAQYSEFALKNYSSLKKQRIICRNDGAKLTFETLAELVHEGARLIPFFSV